jgi:hypothetical protein
VEVTDSYKYSTLISKGVNYDLKSFTVQASCRKKSIVNRFSVKNSFLTLQHNKLECTSLTSIFSQVQCFCARQGAACS